MPWKLTIATLSAIVLIALLVWQERRLEIVRACTQSGGYWDGVRSKCRPPPVRILLERNLKRS